MGEKGMLIVMPIVGVGALALVPPQHGLVLAIQLANDYNIFVIER